MRVIYNNGASESIIFAASQLELYLNRMVSGLADDPFEIKLQVQAEQSALDGFSIRIAQEGGTVTGSNDRSVLIGIYDYLHYLGCRFLLPTKEGERIPKISRDSLNAQYEKKASFRHRGVCIEGADSIENIRDFIDWLPKVGYNSFFLQFKVPYAFLARWYHHDENPYRDSEAFTFEDAVRCLGQLEAELKKRGLMLHKVGHGWTGEALGYQTASWDANDDAFTPQTKRFAAQTNGKRQLHHGVPANTNLCYHSSEAVDVFAASVVSYAKNNPQMDYLHIWLADEYNNVCECEECVKTTLSDQYVSLLNEIDRRLSEEMLDTKIVFLLYQELLWPPIKERLHHPERFVLMFAPISRTFEASYNLDEIPDTLPEYVRNRIVLPSSLGENLAYLRGWQKQFEGDSFVYDYPLGRAHYGDFGYLHIARVISGDIKKLKEMKLDGYISCQELRACLPNAIPNYMMAYTLFDENADPEEIIREYFEAAYGENAQEAKAYLERLSQLGCCDYINGKGERVNPDIASQMKCLIDFCEEFWSEHSTSEPINPDSSERVVLFFWHMLAYHSGVCCRLGRAVQKLAEGDKEQALMFWREFRKYICDGEQEFQPYLDVYRILEVTQKYTGLKEADDWRFA